MLNVPPPFVSMAKGVLEPQTGPFGGTSTAGGATWERAAQSNNTASVGRGVPDRRSPCRSTHVRKVWPGAGAHSRGGSWSAGSGGVSLLFREVPEVESKGRPNLGGGLIPKGGAFRGWQRCFDRTEKL